MKFSYKWLQTYFDKKLPKPKELAEVLTLHSFETEADGDVLEIDVLPNRAPDCYSHFGVAKEISALLDSPLKNMEMDGLEFGQSFIKVEILETRYCPRYLALIVKNVKIAKSPKWLRERLESVGQRSINNVVDIGNYVMLEIGQPLHAFDLAKLEGRKIIVRGARNEEQMETLDGQKLLLDEKALVVADAKDPLAVAGIKGGKKAEITGDTKDIVIEAASFENFSIRKTSRAINIKTDASIRFEHGVSLCMPEIALRRMLYFVREIAGGEAAGLEDVSFVRPSSSFILFSEEDVERLTGVKVSRKEIEDILRRLNFKLEEQKGNLLVSPPRERLDVNIKEDVVEEVIRIYGYKNVKPVLPENITVVQERNSEYFYANAIRDILVQSGFSEVCNYSFGKFGSEELENPISNERKYLRDNLTAGLKENIENNFKNFDSVKIFEIGKVFGEGVEKMNFAMAVGHRDEKKKKEEIPELKGDVDELRSSLGISVDFIGKGIIEGNCFEIDLGKIIELAGENIDLSVITRAVAADARYKPFSKFPAVTRDISLFVPINTRVEEVLDIIENTAGELLIDTDLFDMYQPPDGERKSFAFRLVFQSFEKTLTDAEVNGVVDKIIKSLEQNTQWEVRK